MSEKQLTLLDGGRDVVQFDPEKTHVIVSALEAAIEKAKRMRDWEKLFKAVDWLIEEQREFVAWWDASVRHNSRPITNAEPHYLSNYLSAPEATSKTHVKQYQVSRWRTGLARPDYRAKLARPSLIAGLGEEAQNRADLQTGEMEWYTPAVYIEKARRVLGAFDLDPASCAAPQEVIRAETYFTKEDDGLKQKWHGRVWLNPPYAGKIVAAFAEKMVKSWNAGDLEAALMLTNSYTETSWWHALTGASTAVCFTRGRIKFESPHGEKCAPTNGQTFFYFGSELERFRAAFDDVGTIMGRFACSSE